MAGCKKSDPHGSRVGPGYPPLRGTMVSLDQKRTILCAHGSVQFFEENEPMRQP
jgi:hypothetical protein